MQIKHNLQKDAWQDRSKNRQIEQNIQDSYGDNAYVIDKIEEQLKERGSSTGVPIQDTFTPGIFSKKKSQKDIKPLKYITNDTGKTRHYPPGAQ